MAYPQTAIAIGVGELLMLSTDEIRNLGGGGDMLATVLVVVVILMLVGALPRWGHSRSWGYGPSGGLGLVLVILLILLLLGRI